MRLERYGAHEVAGHVEPRRHRLSQARKGRLGVMHPAERMQLLIIGRLDPQGDPGETRLAQLGEQGRAERVRVCFAGEFHDLGAGLAHGADKPYEVGAQ